MEKALLVTIKFKHEKDTWRIEDIADEMEQLSRAAGVEVVDNITTICEKPTSNLLIGKGKVEELAKISDEDVTQRISKEMPYIPLLEFNRIVNNLKAQMFAAANNLEYERAAQIRDRIKELAEKKGQLTNLGKN